MTAISTHVLDTSLGHPAAAVSVTLHRRTLGGEWELVATATTNADGRVPTMPLFGAESSTALGEPSIYRLSFDVEQYFRERGQKAFFPEVQVSFEIDDLGRHTHVPLLLSPFGYTTYRGS